MDAITVTALVFAWFAFRYERHRRWRSAIEAAHGTLRAVYHGMVEGLTPGQRDGWGQLYFLNGYTDDDATKRSHETLAAVMAGGMDQVYVVPTEPLAKLATATPQDDLIDYETIAAANFALWRVHVFNQLVGLMTDFFAAHLPAIASANQDEREGFARAATTLSWFVHGQGIGQSWRQENGGRGWYGTLVDALDRNMATLDDRRRRHLRHLVFGWPVLFDALAVGLLAGVIVALAT